MTSLRDLDPPNRCGLWNVGVPLNLGPHGPRFAADPVAPDTPSAVLTLLGDGRVDDADALEGFARRMERLMPLKSEGIDTPLAFGVEDARAWIATPARDPIPLVAWVNGHSGDERYRCVAELGARIARAVAAAHDVGVLHRDLAPAHVDVTDDLPLVGGFGVVSDPWSPGVLARDHEGDARFKAPEQARGENAEVRTDVWGVGAILYALLAARAPADVGSPTETLLAIRSRPAPPLRKIAPDVPADLMAVVDRAMSFRIQRRYADCRALAADLEKARRGEPVPAAEQTLLDLLQSCHRGVIAALAIALLALFFWLHLRGGAS